MLTMAMPALADDESDRVREVEDYLGRVKDKLDGIAGKSSADDINSALDYLDKVKEQVERLKSMGPKNEPGITMANNYLDYISKFREAAKNLKYMKEAQVAQEKDQLAERCKDTTAKFRADLATFVDRKDPNGLNKIPDIAERLGREYGEALSKMEDKHREMDRWKGDARNFFVNLNCVSGRMSAAS